MDILETYFKINRNHERDYMHLKKDEENLYNRIEHNIFDNERELYGMMNKRAKELEEKYRRKYT